MRLTQYIGILTFTIFFTGCAMDSGGNVNDKPAVDAAVVAPDVFIDPGDRDKDDDGFTPNQGDCNDEDAEMHPGFEEICDGRDNDCNGLIDEGCGCEDGDTQPCGTDEGACVAGVQVCVDRVWGDECHGGQVSVEEVCGDNIDNDCDGQVDEGCQSGPVDADGDGVLNTTDCDDSNANIYPGAVEVCGNNVDDNCNGQVDENCGGGLVDNDGDGYLNSIDCNDNNAQVYPGALELCDGFDNNCDGQIDEGCGGGFVDNDNDGYLNSVDCNDSNSSIHPGAQELCGDGVDNNCDGSVDEGCSGLVDNDNDGYLNSVDCNDSNSNIHPGAQEVCGNNVDDNCNGQVDENCGGGLVDNDGDGYLNSIDCNDNNAQVYPGAFESCDGFDNNCDGQIDEGCSSCPDLIVNLFGGEIVLSGQRALDFQVIEFWDGVNPNVWVNGIQGATAVHFPVPAGNYTWFIPYTGTGPSNRGAVLYVEDPCVSYNFGVYLCDQQGAVNGTCSSLTPCSAGGDTCPLPPAP